MMENSYEEMLSKKVHDAWMEEKANQGFTYGETLDLENKKHPDMVPYEELPDNVKEYDRSTVRAVLKAQREVGIVPTLRVNAMYPAFMGEVNCLGIGAPATFIRLAGCNLRCYYKTKGCFCDTPEALSMKSGKDMSVGEIVNTAKHYGNPVVCLTGGEPLMQDVRRLVEELTNAQFDVVIETNGSIDITPYRHIRHVSFVVDVKSASSGESERMQEINYGLLDDTDFVKFVIDTEEDFDEFVKWVEAHNWVDCKIAVGLLWGSKLTYQWLMKQLISLDRVVHVNMQAHKMACMYDKYKSDESFSNLFIPKDI